MQISKSQRNDSTISVELLKIPNYSTSIPPAGCIAYQPNTLMVSTGSQWLNAGSTSPGSTLIYRPGYTGPEGVGIYGTWQPLYDALILIQGTKYITFEDSLNPVGTPIVIPAGQWDMTNTTWFIPLCMINSPPELFVHIHIADGATVNGLCCIDGPSVVTFFGTTAPAITISGLPGARRLVFPLWNGAQITCAGTQPFFRLATGFGEVILGFGSAIIAGPTPVIVSETGSQLIIPTNGFATIENNVFGGGGDILVTGLAPGVQMSIPPVQATFLGTLIITYTYTSPNTYQRGVAPIATDDESKGYKVGDIWVNTAANTFYTCVVSSTGAAVWKGPF